MRKSLVILLSLLLLPLAKADLIIAPQNMNINVIAGTTNTYQLVLYNSYSFQIYDVKFNGLEGFSFPSDISLAPSENKTINFNVNTNSQISSQITSIVKFNYLVDLPTNPTTYYINITSNGYSPNDITIRTGDTIIWTNKDSITHSVTSSRFDLTIPPNLTSSYTFNNIETLNYQDLILFFTGTINIINKTALAKVNNPNYDTSWIINLNSSLSPTTIQLFNMDSNNITLSTNSNFSGMFKISNTGNNLAKSVHLSHNSDKFIIAFEHQDFDIPLGTYQYIRYNIIPLIYNTSDTDKNYSLTITASSKNSNPSQTSISIYVPYSDVTTFLNASQSLTDLFLAFCKQYPQYCQNQSSGQPKIIYKDLELPINMTALQRYDLIKTIQSMADTISRTDNKVKEVSDTQNTLMYEQSDLQNKTYEKIISMDKSYKTNWNVIWVLGFIIFIAWLITAIIRRFNSYKSEKNYLDSGYVT